MLSATLFSSTYFCLLITYVETEVTETWSKLYEIPYKKKHKNKTICLSQE